MITKFRDESRFLSNFWYCNNIILDGVELPTVEHGYIVCKVGSVQDFLDKSGLSLLELQEMKPGKLKRVGRKVTLRKDWEQIKVYVMFRLLWQKFQNEQLKRQLLETGKQKLIEGNHWHDNFWGSCSCEKCQDKGLNMLGQLLMVIRSLLS